MSSVLDFVDFGSTFFGQPDKKRVKRQQYLTQNIDYYKQGLDATGIKVSDPERWSDIEEEKKRKVDISQVGVTEGGEDQDLTATDMANLGGGVSNALSSSSSLEAINASFIDYNTSLQNAGFKDRSQSFLSKNFGISLAAPQSVKDVKQDVKSITAEKVARSVGKKALGILGFNPIATNVLGAFAPVTTVQDPLGNPSGRPSHAVMGTVMDINYSIQSNNISQSIAAMNANNLTGYGGQKSPTGFFGYIGGQLVSRAPLGIAYTGTTDLEIGQLTALEAISKGYAPLGYNTRTEVGTNSMAVNTGFGRGYDERGYLQTINGAARAGSMTDVVSTAKQYGIDVKDVLNSLKEVRNNLTFWGNVKDPDKPTLSQSLAEKSTKASDKKAGITGVTYGSGLGVAAGAVGSSGNLGGPTGAGYQSTDTDPSSPSTDPSPDAYGGIDGPADAAASSSSSDGGESSDSGAESMGGEDVAYGGKIGNGFALGGRRDAELAGFIGGPPENYSDQTTIADDIPLKVKDGTFVINAPAVEYAGSIDIQKMLAEGYQKAMTRDIGVDKNFRIGKIPSREELDIQISRGEVVVPPHVAKAIGYDRLEKINNRGKREVERRQKAGNQEKVQAGEGFAAKGGNQKVTLYRGEPSKIPKRATLLQDKYTGSWFSPNKNFTKTYGEVAKTMELTFDEYKKGAKKAFLKKNIARHMVEKEESKLPKNLTKNEKSRIFQSLKYIDYMANEVKRGNRSVKAFTDFMYEGVFPKEKDKATIMLLETAKRSPKAFGKLVVDSLVKNVVSKGIPVLGTVTGFAPSEMGDATLSGEKGFIYDYTPIKNPSATQ